MSSHVLLSFDFQDLQVFKRQSLPRPGICTQIRLNRAKSRHGLHITELTSWTPLRNVPCLPSLPILGSIQLWRAFVCCFGIFGASLLESLAIWNKAYNYIYTIIIPISDFGWTPRRLPATKPRVKLDKRKKTCFFLFACSCQLARPCLLACLLSLMTFLVCTVLQAACRLSIISSLTRLKWMDTTRSMANSAIQGSTFYNHPGEKQFLHSQSNYWIYHGRKGSFIVSSPRLRRVRAESQGGTTNSGTARSNGLHGHNDGLHYIIM